jgi:hypothetical protein
MPPSRHRTPTPRATPPRAGEIARPTLELLSLCVPEAEPLLKACDANIAHWELVAANTVVSAEDKEAAAKRKRQAALKKGGPDGKGPMPEGKGGGRRRRPSMGLGARASKLGVQGGAPAARKSHKQPALADFDDDAEEPSATVGRQAGLKVGGMGSKKASSKRLAMRTPALVPGARPAI